MTGGRLKRVSEFLNNETFCFTYGDGVADINITELIEFHRKNGREATLTAVKPPGRFGSIEFERGKVLSLYMFIFRCTVLSWNPENKYENMC